MSHDDGSMFRLLVRRSHGEARAMAVIEEMSNRLGLIADPGDTILAAVGLVQTGASPESVSSLMSWNQFEDFCARLLKAGGYEVKRNIVITKPRRQIDIFAVSSSLALSVDCKHWERGFSYSALQRIAALQIERTSLYKRKSKLNIPVLPVILTLLDAPTRLVGGVPVVPVFALRDFLSFVSPFEEGLQIL
jgi:hypothetical protein